MFGQSLPKQLAQSRFVIRLERHLLKQLFGKDCFVVDREGKHLWKTIQDHGVSIAEMCRPSISQIAAAIAVPISAVPTRLLPSV